MTEQADPRKRNKEIQRLTNKQERKRWEDGWKRLRDSLDDDLPPDSHKKYNGYEW